MAKRLISSENYTVPVMLALLVHVLVLGGFFIVWTTTPEIPIAKPTMMATLYELQSKSPALSQTSEKIAGDAQKTVAPTSKEDQMATQKQEADQKIAQEKAAQLKKQVEEKAKAELKKKTEEKVKAEELVKKKLEEKTKADALAKKKAEEKAKADVLTKKKAEEKAKADALAKKTAEDKAKADAKAKADSAARKAQEDKEAAALADLLGDKPAHAATKGDQVGSQLTSGIDDLIKQLVQENWVELGNPVPGTQVELSIQMLPDGTITNVTVSRSSGNIAFDNSAVSAAKNVGRIRKVQTLDTNTFNRLYRQRTFVFTSKGL